MRVAGDTAGKGIGKPECSAKGKHGHGVGAANRGGKGRDGAAHDVSMWIAPRHHAPGGLGRDDGAGRLKPAGPLDTRPKLSEAAKLGDGEELVLVRGEPEKDVAARGVERNAASFQRAEVSDGIGEHEGKLLRLGAARRMDGSPVGNGEGAGEALIGKFGDAAGDEGRELGPRHGGKPA